MISADTTRHHLERRLPYENWCHMATDGDLTERHQLATCLPYRFGRSHQPQKGA